MQISRLTLAAGLALVTLGQASATLCADNEAASTTPSSTTATALRAALDNARANLQHPDQDKALQAVNGLLKALALAGTEVRVKRDQAADQTVITMRVFVAGQLHLATCANADCFQATVACAAEILKAFEVAKTASGDAKK